MEAEKAGVEHAGGKIDDITVVVAQVVASSTSFTTPASLGFGFEHTNTKRKREDYIRLNLDHPHEPHKPVELPIRDKRIQIHK
ncbi:unnamed protein product [Prunus brigantina]